MLCVDEKSQIQALDRTAPTLPMQIGIPERQTHDYVRNGTTTLFAALNLATGQITGVCKPRHPHQEFLDHGGPHVRHCPPPHDHSTVGIGDEAGLSD